MIAARITILSALLFSTGACTLADEPTNLSDVESEGRKSPGSTTTTTGPTCSGVDLMSDANNCGSCGNVCGSGLCYSGVCADATAGHVFAIGHGYETSNGALDKMLGNAVFMNERSTLRVLAYAGSAPASYINGANAAMDRQASARGRVIQRTTFTNSADLQVRIADADVFVVYAQPTADSQYLYFLGDEWSIPLSNFARRGGTIVVLDSNEGTNLGTAQILIRPGFMTLSGRAPAGNMGYVADAEDVAVARVPMMFGLNKSVSWTPSSSWSNSATTENGGALVIHRAFY